MASVKRILRHLFATHAHMRRLFPSEALDRLEQAIRAAESGHGGEIRLVIESELDLGSLIRGKSAVERARDVFGRFGVWDTDANNGVLIYLLLADRHVEIVADRGFRDLVTPADWARVCAQMESEFRAGRFEAGAAGGIEAVGQLIGRHFPDRARRNELPDRPVLL